MIWHTKDNELQSKLSAPAADAVMTKPPAAEPGKKNVKSDKDELAKEVEKVSEQIAVNDAENAIQQKPYVFPTVDLLKAPDRGKTGDSQAHLRETAAKLEQTLNVFGVNAKVNNISCGPAVTRFEITPELGVKVSKIVNLADDIKLNLAAADIRIEAPIPGKPLWASKCQTARVLLFPSGSLWSLKNLKCQIKDYLCSGKRYCRQG